MRDLVRKPVRVETPEYDPGTLWYRRAVGLELRVRPEETWAELELIRDGKRQSTLSREVARKVIGLSRWTHAKDIDLKPQKLWRLVAEGLLFFSVDEPDRHLTGEVGQLARGGPIARRASMWPTVAVETAIQIAPMPFMPRGGDLRGAEMVGVRFASLERGVEVLGVTITGSKATGRVLRELLPLLDGSLDASEIIARVSDPRTTKKMLDLLDDVSALTGGAKAPILSDLTPQVTWLGHAAVLLTLGGVNLLVDPLFFSMSEPEVSERKVDPRSLPKIDAVLITHGDNDHLNPNSLAQLSPDTPIYAPRVGNEPPPFQVDIYGMLKVLGFTNVVEVEPDDAFDVGGCRVTTLPFEGESWGLPLAKVTFLVEGEGKSVFFAADSNEMPSVYEALAGRVDLAFMGVSGNAETYVMPPGFGYGNFYADWIPRARHQEWVQHCAGPKEALASLRLMKPKQAFGYAAGGASFIRTEYSDAGSHEELAALIEASDLETEPVTLELGVPHPL